MTAPNTESTYMYKQASDGGPDGLKIGQSTTDKIGFYGATPIVQRSGAAQGAVSTTAITAVATTAPTSTTPYGFDSTQAAAIITAVNSLITQGAALVALSNELRASLTALNLVKGSA